MSKKIINESIAWQDITPGGDIYASGNSAQFITGDWRTDKPIFVEDKCIQCLLCVPVCPDTAIPVKESKRFDFNYDHCKGCGVCAKVCPVKAIEMIQENK
jgi:pyruvate ferredoxin oxidoreductase delta subunit